MIDSTPAASAAVADERAGGTTELMVERHAGGQAAEARDDALAQTGHGASAVALQREQVLGRPEERRDALADGAQMETPRRLVKARRSRQDAVEVLDLGGEVGPGVAFVGHHDLAPSALAARKQLRGDLALVA